MKKINIGIIGCGTVGYGVVKALLRRRSLLKKRIGMDIVVSAVCDKKFYVKKPKGVDKSILMTDFRKVVKDPNIDIIVELIGGIKVAKMVVETALNNKKFVVTANKALIAYHGKQLFDLAKKNGVDLYFEASVGAGIPVVKSLKESFVASNMNTIYGIINGTSNYILSKMGDDSCTLEIALEEAQRLGFAESDPYLDISGYDSTHKLAILVLLAFGKYVSVDSIYTEGIKHIRLQDIEYAEEMGYVVKSLAIAKIAKGKLEVRVHPTLLSKRHLLANVRGVLNAVYTKGDIVGESLLYGEGAGERSAASGVLSDVIDAAKAVSSGSFSYYNFEFADKGIFLKKIDNIRSRYYMRISAIDKPGVLAKVSGILGRFNISIASVSQKEHSSEKIVPVVMMSHEAEEKDMKKALSVIDKLSEIKSKTVAIRVED